MHRWLLAGFFFCCVGLDAAAVGQESPLAQFQAMVNQADSYSVAYRQYQALQSSLANTRADEGNPTQDIFPGVSPAQWQTMGNTLRQRAIAESSAFDAVLLLNLKKLNQSPPPKYCLFAPQWLAVAPTAVLSKEQSKLFAQLMALRQSCRQKQPSRAKIYALEMKYLVEAYERYDRPDLAIDTLRTGYSELDKRQGQDRRGLAFLLSHSGSDPSLTATSLRLTAQIEPAELRLEVIERLMKQPQFNDTMAELVEIAGVPDQFSSQWISFANSVARKGDIYLVEPGLTQMLSQPDLNEQQRKSINQGLAIGYLIANDPQASLTAYARIKADNTDESETLLYDLAEYDKSAAYVQHIWQRINAEVQPTPKAYLLFNFAYQYIKAGQFELGVDMYQQALTIMFKNNFHKTLECGWAMVDSLLQNGLIEQAELINARFNTETMTNGAGESFSPPLRKESEFAVAYARAGDFYRALQLLLSAEQWGSRNADNAITLIDIYADAGEFALAERAAAWANFYPANHVKAWLHVAKGYLKHGDLEKAKARLNQALSLLKYLEYDNSVLFTEIAQVSASMNQLPPELLASAKAQTTNSSLVSLTKVYADAGQNNLALQVIAQINGLDDQLAALRWLQFNKDTQLSLDDSGKAQLAKIIQQQFPLKAFWQQARQ